MNEAKETNTTQLKISQYKMMLNEVWLTNLMLHFKNYFVKTTTLSPLNYSHQANLIFLELIHK